MQKDEKYEINIVKQKSTVGKVAYEIKEIYGIEKASDTGECVICLTSKRDTMLLPCRHICICVNCAEQMSKKTTNCPICRASIFSFSNQK